MESTPKNNCSSDPQNTNVSSKLLPVFDDPKITAHLYLPESKPNEKFPILVYVHGGAFRRHPRSLSAESHALVVSVNYKPAAEHYSFETAYDVCFTALQWVASHRSGHEKEPWLLVHGDFGRVSIGGDSPDRNMIHKLVKRAGYEGLFNKDWVPIGNSKFAMARRALGALHAEESKRASGFTYVVLNTKLYRECIVPVIKAALLRQLGTSSSVHKNINELEMERYSLELCKGVCVMTFSLHSMNHQTMFKYARKPNLPSLFEVPIPYAFAISQLGFFEVSSMTKEIILVPDVTEEDAASFLLDPQQSTWSPAAYTEAVEFAKKIGIQFLSVDQSMKQGTSWWMYKVRKSREEGGNLILECPFPEDNFIEESAVIRMLFLRIDEGEELNRVFEIEAVSVADYGSMGRRFSNDVAVDVFFAVEFGIGSRSNLWRLDWSNSDHCTQYSHTTRIRPNHLKGKNVKTTIVFYQNFTPGPVPTKTQTTLRSRHAGDLLPATMLVLFLDQLVFVLIDFL